MYDPGSQKIFFIPHEMSSSPVWHYYNVINKTAETYNHGISSLVTHAYFGGVYDFERGQVLFIRGTQQPSGPQLWHGIKSSFGSSFSKFWTSHYLFNPSY